MTARKTAAAPQVRILLPSLPAFLLLVSCVSLPGRYLESAVYDTEKIRLLAANTLSLGEIDIRYDDGFAEFSYPLAEILKPMAMRHGFTLTMAGETEEKPKEAYVLQLWLKEEAFSKDLGFRNSITGAFFVREAQGGRMIFSLSYAEESAETIRSFRHLCRIFDILFERMAHEAAKKPLES